MSVPRPGPNSTSRACLGEPAATHACCHPYAEHLAKHLADFGRRDEIAAAPKGIARHVIAERRMAQAQRHVTLERDRPLLLHHRGDFVAEVAHASACFRRVAKTIIATPRTIIGADKTIPMVSPLFSAS